MKPKILLALDGSEAAMRAIDPADNQRVVDKFRDITEITEHRYATDDLVATSPEPAPQMCLRFPG